MAPAKNLQQLLQMRAFAVLAQVFALVVAIYIYHLELPILPMLAIIFLLMAVSFYAIYCINKQKISNSTLFWQMLFDVLALAGQIYFSGGISNPFISLFLLQVVVASILLKTSYAWLIGIITCFFYALLSHYSYQQPAVLQHHHTFDFHLQGMMLVHFLSSFLLIFFISKIMQNIAFEQQKNQELNQKILSKQKLAEMGLLATNTISHIYVAYNTNSINK